MPDPDLYPLFENAEAYLRKRQAGSLRARVQRWNERRAIRRALRPSWGVHSVCDIPCGAGRSFPLWAKRGWRIEGVEFSDPMVAAARASLQDLEAEGSVRQQDAFEFDALPPSCDLVICLRFIYYFHAGARRRLLEALRRRTRRYLLIQYRIHDTLAGRWRQARAKRRAMRRQTKDKPGCSTISMHHEIEEAGFRILRIVRHGALSDRVLVLAEHLQGAATSKAPREPLAQVPH